GEGQGMRQMFLLMNAARIAVGVQSLGVASVAFLNALRYARERKQGPSVKHFKDPTAPRVPIIEHADIRRMLLDMKARVEGIRALICKLAAHRDRYDIATTDGVGDANYHLGQIELLTPVVKAYGSDQAFRICETAIQTLGGVGYTADYGIEQYCRDSKVFSIYEGTNHIQAMDLIGRKLSMQNGAFAQAFQKDINDFIAKHRDHKVYGPSVAQLEKAATALQGATMKLMSWFFSGQLEMVPLFSTRFLEMLAETTIGWLLLEQAILGEQKRAELPEGHTDHAFYLGKHFIATYFAGNVLPGVASKADLLNLADRSALDITDASFATI
ncbi:MAG TPA: acyl-CoA dehydrogenase, partial [Pseudomonadota bacterium]|nr:acyl-CoA dehydrogenase [Pseudomonadota bacterium]